MKHLTLIIIYSLLLIGYTFAEAKESADDNTNGINGIPQEWVEQQGNNVLLYAKYIESLELKNITPYKVLYPHFKRRGRTSNSIPPKNLWKNIAEVLTVVDQISTNLDAEVMPFISAYRSPEYNKSVRGKSSSYALANKAVKISFVNVTSRQVGEAARKLRSADFFRGGIGVYSSFVYLDTRGVNASW